MKGERIQKIRQAAEKVGGNPVVRWFRRVIGDFTGNHCNMHAAGLTYFSLLTVVPLVCILLVGAKVCGADDYAKRELNGYLDSVITDIEHGQDDDLAKILPGGDEKQQEQKKQAAYYVATQVRGFTEPLFERIQSFDIKTFGWIGFGMLLWTVVSAIGMIEVSFNEIWQVTKARAIWRRFLLYLGLVVVLPFAVALALSPQILNTAKNVIVCVFGASWLTQWVSDGLIWLIDSWVFRSAITFSVSSLVFAVLFWLIPNCRVRFRWAWLGGAVTALALGGWMKLCTVAQVGISKSSAMYGSFAILPILLAWMYMSWQIVLLGACIVHAFRKEEVK